MADRYWVGGTDTWNATAGTKWATTSGGAGGASVPTSADDVFFDANSGNVTVSTFGTRSSKSLDFTGFTGTFTQVSTLLIYGSLTIPVSCNYDASGRDLEFYLGPTPININAPGRNFDEVFIIALASTGGSGVANLQGDFNCDDLYPYIEIGESGRLNLNGHTLTATRRFYYKSNSFAGVFTLDMTNSIVNCPEFQPGLSSVRDITIISNNSTLNIDNVTSFVAGDFGALYLGAQTLNEVNVTNSRRGMYIFGGGYTINELNYNSPYVLFIAGSGTFSTFNKTTSGAITGGNTFTSTPTTSITFGGVDIRNSTISNITSATLIKAKNSFDAGGNININFVDVPANLATTVVTPTNRTTTPSAIINITTNGANVTNL